MHTEYGKSRMLYFHSLYAQHVIITKGVDPFNLVNISDVVTISLTEYVLPSEL